jgi:PKD repeat protein
MIQGETTWLEYYAPSHVTENPIIQISNVVYIYRGVEDFVNPFIQEASDKESDLYIKADACQVDVACSPENNGWDQQIDAAVHFTFQQGGGFYVCSASLLNNASQDCTPYILTAWHCGEKNANQTASGFTWYWNYQKTSCQPNSNGNDPSKGNQTMINGSVVSSSGSGSLNNPPSNQQVAGSDYVLVELNSTIPSSYNAYYAGWNAGTSSASSGVSIHHPSGSAKKISTFTSSLSSATYNGGAANAHWRVYWAGTTNGHGVTEGGSSGSPIFDQNGRVVGQLSGGSSFCTNTNSPDLYGKFSKNWNGNGGTNSTSNLQPLLDPGNTGVNFLDGAYEPCNQNNPPTCAIAASTTTITAGGSIIFSDASTGNPTNWSWDFDNTSQGGVSPLNSTAQNPGAVTYSNAGTYEVELTATNANGTCTTTQNITVNAPGSSTGCDTLSNIGSADSATIYSVNNGGYVSGWNGYGDLSKCDVFSNYSPYTSINGMQLFLYGVNDGGNGATVDFNVWDDNNGQPGSIIATTQISLSALDAAIPNGGGLYNVSFPSAVTLNGNPVYCGLTMNGFAAYPGGQDSLGIITNSFNDPTANTGWEQWSDNTWYTYDSQNSFGITLSHYIFPIFCGGCGSSLIINPTTTNPTCNQNNGVIAVTTSGGTTPYQYSIDGGTTFQGSGTFSNLAPNTYNVVIQDASGCSETNIITLTNQGGVTATISSTQSICSGNSASISAGGAGNGGSYQWDNGLGSGASHVVSPTSTTTYNVVVTDANGCTDNASVIVVVNTAPNVTVNPSTATICGGESILISASGAQTYSWNTGSSGSSITVNPTNQTTYTVIGSNGNCPGNPATSTISVTAAPTVIASANPTTISVGGTVSFSSAGSGATSYVWDFGDGNSSTQTNPSHTYSSSGIYVVTLTGTLNGCTNTSLVTINVGGVTIDETDLKILFLYILIQTVEFLNYL